MRIQLDRLVSVVKDHKSLISFLRIASVAALVCTGALEAFNIIKSSPGEIGAGVAAGTALAAALKMAHLV